MSPAGRRVGSGGRTGAGSCCTSRVGVFFGKLHVFSSLVSASPERGRMSHCGVHIPDLGAGKGAAAGTPRGKVTELFRILVLEPGPGQGVEAGMRARMFLSPLLGEEKKRGRAFSSSACRAQVGVVRILRSATRCNEVIPGPSLQPLRALDLDSVLAYWRNPQGPARPPE